MGKANINNTAYEERLGTDRMLPLVLRMAMPSVAAQIVNLLYNLVDRIYIGHIPGIGTDALAGIGVTGGHNNTYFCVFGNSQWRRCSVGSHSPRSGRQKEGRADLG